MNRKEAIEHFKEMSKIIISFDTSACDKYLNISRIACGTSWYPTEEMERKTYGEEKFIAIQVIDKTFRVGNWSEIYRKLNKLEDRLKNETDRKTAIENKQKLTIIAEAEKKSPTHSVTYFVREDDFFESTITVERTVSEDGLSSESVAEKILSSFADGFEVRHFDQTNCLSCRLFKRSSELNVEPIPDVSIQELEEMSAEIETWLKKMKPFMEGLRVQIAIIQTVIDEKAEKKKALENTAEFKTKIAETNAIINARNDQEASVRDRGSHCYLLFSDGEICSTKAGEDLFLNRSMFGVKPPIAGISSTIFKFPQIWDQKGMTYVILANSQIANDLRNEMLKVYNMPEETKSF